MANAVYKKMWAVVWKENGEIDYSAFALRAHIFINKRAAVRFIHSEYPNDKKYYTIIPIRIEFIHKQ